MSLVSHTEITKLTEWLLRDKCKSKEAPAHSIFGHRIYIPHCISVTKLLTTHSRVLEAFSLYTGQNNSDTLKVSKILTLGFGFFSTISLALLLLTDVLAFLYCSQPEKM